MTSGGGRCTAPIRPDGCPGHDGPRRNEARVTLPALATALAVAVAVLPSVALAAASDVGPALRAQAEAVCRDDALRLCADAIPDQAAILACMRPKRASLTAPCREVFDEVMRDVRR